MIEANETTETELEPMPPIKRGDVLYSSQHDVLVIKLGDGCAVFIKADGTLVDKGTICPIPLGDPVYVIDEPQQLLAALVSLVRKRITGETTAS